MGAILRIGLLTLASAASAIPALAVLPPASTGEFYVGSFNTDDIKVYDPSGAYLRSFTGPGLDGPRGIVIHAQAGKIYIASQLGNEIFVFSDDEHYLTKFNAPGFMNSPTGMALSPGGVLYVASFNNDRVLVFETDGTYLRHIEHADINGPNCVAFDSQGYFYVANAINDKVVKFDAAENHVASFAWPGHADSAMGLARDTADNLYVAGGNSDDITKFSTTGELLDVLTHEDLVGPQGVAFDDRGHLFSSSFYSPYNVVEFDPDGKYVQTISEGGLVIARSVAFIPMPLADLTGDGVVDAADLAVLLGGWGPCGGCAADLNDDGIVNAADLAILLGSWS